MSCPHATTTTIAWLYGEADDAHALHVADCPACAAVVEEQEAVMAAVLPATPRGAAPEPIPEPVRVRRSPWPWVGGAVALAAAVLLAVRLAPGPQAVPASVALPAPAVDDAVALLDEAPSSVWSGDLEADLADIDASLDALAADLTTL